MPPNHAHQVPRAEPTPHAPSHSGVPKLVDASVQAALGVPPSKPGSMTGWVEGSTHRPVQMAMSSSRKKLSAAGAAAFDCDSKRSV